MDQFYVYLWRDPKDGTPRYVGKGKTQRCWTHLERGGNRKTSSLLKKRYHEGFVCIPTVRRLTSESEAFELENLLIQTIGREDLGTGPLFNLTDGGQGQAGRRFTPEHRAKLSKSGRGRKITGEGLISIQRAARNRVFSPEALARIGASASTRKTLLGRKHTPESIEKMRAAKRGKAPWNKGLKKGGA